MGQPTVPKDTTKAGSFSATSPKRKGHDPESLRQCRDEKLGGGGGNLFADAENQNGARVNGFLQPTLAAKNSRGKQAEAIS